MRDGVHLHTVVDLPIGGVDIPRTSVIDRSPYCMCVALSCCYQRMSPLLFALIDLSD